MRARAVLAVERGPDGRTRVAELRTGSPLALLPRRGTAAARETALTVHVVGSASTPLAGDDVELDVHVGDGAHLELTGVAAAIALPGRDRPSSLTIRLTVGADASVRHRPESTVVTARADHRTRFEATLHPTASLSARETVVLGRIGERAGRLTTSTRIREEGLTLFAQDLELGDARLQRSPAHLAGHRVLAQEVVIAAIDPDRTSCGDNWSLVPLGRRGSVAAAVGRDAVTAAHGLEAALANHPAAEARRRGPGDRDAGGHASGLHASPPDLAEPSLTSHAV
ncbi:urease accessory protein UreD [Pseudonocardia endophytica]|uniref:Urease accessory protein UreD n=1 Tax=Pseudonocardia endophytica TaxID=401976 RepID=A0A4R1HST3_PSEEN|nr:urease accessory protein UreD [Pseudonocardia endophytica]TCK24401.1 urease accessory protein [Pseudonocardia endophytica]